MTTNKNQVLHCLEAEDNTHTPEDEFLMKVVFADGSEKPVPTTARCKLCGLIIRGFSSTDGIKYYTLW